MRHSNLFRYGCGALALVAAGCARKSSPEWVRPAPTPLTSEARFDGEPALSPDGRQVVISSHGEADLDLFVIDPARPSERRLLLANPGDDRQPAYSPDGNRLAWTNVTGNESDILMTGEGGDIRRITVEPGRDRQPAWSADGTRLAFVSDRSGRAEVWVVTLSTGQAVPVSSAVPPSSDYVLADPAWRGEAIVVSAQVGGETDLWEIPAAGGAWKRLTSGPSRERHPSPGPAGRLAFTSDTTGYANLYVREADGRVSALTDERTDIFESRWTGDGARLIYGRTSPWALLSRPLGGGAVDTVQAAWGRNLHPSWSPDATELAFHSDLDGQDDIWRVGVADGGAGPVTASRADDRDPDWSPTANRIVFTSARSGNDDVWIMDPSGVEYLNLTNDPAGDRQARWSPDGTRVVFVSDRLGATDLWLVGAAGGEPRRVTNDAVPEAWPCLLADGRTIVYEADRALWAVPIEGGAARRLTTPAPGGWDGRPAPVPTDANRLVFTRAAGGNSGVAWLDVSTGAVTVVADEPGADEDHPAVSRDGSRVAWQSGGNVDVWSIDAAPTPPAATGG
jgi:Tol biopolymer transport system component